MITRTVKLPGALVNKIDGYIEKGEYSTRADFVLHAMRQTLATYSSKKKEMYDTASKFKITDREVNALFSNMSDTFLRGLDEFKGDLIQINTRVPEGLDRKISILVKPEYGLKNKTEYVRASIICLLSVLTEINDVFEDAEKMAAQQKRMTEIINKIVIDGLNNGKSTKEILDMAYDKLKETEM